MSTGKNRAALSNQKPRKAQKRKDQNYSAADRFKDLELLICKRLQTSLNVEELLSFFQDSIPHEMGLQSVHFTPVFHSNLPSKKAFSGHKQNLKLYTGNDYIGQLQLRFLKEPESSSSEILESAARLLAFPLRHALEFQEAIRHSEQDTLTGLKNRNAMNHAIMKASDGAKRYGFPISILMLDIDYFKRINDTYGHLVGDKVLQRLAEVVQQSCRLADQAFRFGGEEFLMLLQNTDEVGALETAERLRKAIEINDFGGVIEEKDLPITVSIGISCHQPEDTRDSLIARADSALYTAKRQGRNRCCTLPSSS